MSRRTAVFPVSPSDSRWAGTTGARVGADAEIAAWDKLAADGFTVVRKPIYVRGRDMRVRIYVR
ncbi:hypothetical protein GCM10023214_63180 [Amycolatopsis dongchuanensis]|uniref:Uncharacterized protein n=1 Tax=Amycolatopsis dongchuanensis TaxID=1070866 RepID=A0ABP8VFK4_9PSEU